MRLPGIRTLLLATYLAVLLLPVAGIGILRLYESALLRQTEAERLVRGALVIDLEAHTASWAGTDVPLTATEFSLLKAIAAQPRRAFTRATSSPGLNGFTT